MENFFWSSAGSSESSTMRFPSRMMRTSPWNMDEIGGLVSKICGLVIRA